MKVTLSSDLYLSVKAALISENIGFAKWKREAMRILEGSGNISTAPDGTRIVRSYNGSHYVGGFPSFVDDGHLTSNPWGQATAKLFGVDSSHGFGGAEDIYPVFVPQNDYETAYPEYILKLNEYCVSLFDSYAQYDTASLYSVGVKLLYQNKIFRCIKDFPPGYPKDGSILPTNAEYFELSIVATGLKLIYDTAYSAMTDAAGFNVHDRYIKKILDWKYFGAMPTWEEYLPSAFIDVISETQSQMSLWWWIEEQWVETSSPYAYDEYGHTIAIETKYVTVLAGYDIDGRAYYKQQLVKKITTKRFSPIYTASYLSFFDYAVDASIWYKGFSLSGGFFWGSEPFLRYDYLISLSGRKFFEFVSKHLSFTTDYPKNDGGFLGMIIMIAAIIVTVLLIVYAGGAGSSDTMAAGSAAAGTSAAATTTASSFELWLAEAGWAAMGDTLGFMALEYGVPALAVEAVGAMALASTAYSYYSTFASLSSVINPPSYPTMETSKIEPPKNTVNWGFGYDDVLALPRFDLPKY